MNPKGVASSHSETLRKSASDISAANPHTALFLNKEGEPLNALFSKSSLANADPFRNGGQAAT